MYKNLSKPQLRYNIYKINAVENIKFVHRLCSTGGTFKSPDIPKSPEWDPIYFFRPIKIATALSNLKLLQFGMTTLGIPLCYALENMTQVPNGTTAIFSAVGISGTATLFIFAKLSSGLVGFLYTNPTMDRVKISYIDFWGKRKNFETDLNDVKPFSEIQTSKYNMYMPLQFYSSQNRFKFLHTFGEIYDFRKFDKVFGG